MSVDLTCQLANEVTLLMFAAFSLKFHSLFPNIYIEYTYIFKLKIINWPWECFYFWITALFQGAWIKKNSINGSLENKSTRQLRVRMCVIKFCGHVDKYAAHHTLNSYPSGMCYFYSSFNFSCSPFPQTHILFLVIVVLKYPGPCDANI